MKHRTQGILAAVAVVMFCTGCQPPPQEAPNQQQARLVAAQNAELQKQLELQRAEIKVLLEKHTKELRQRDQELIRCRVRIEALEQNFKKEIQERVRSVTEPVLNENARLRREIVELKTQIEKLQAAGAQGTSP
jgi:flagellar motility protein MotE (MotC chaperone)